MPVPHGSRVGPSPPHPPATLVFPPSPPFPNFLFSFSSSSPALHYAMKTMPMVVTRRTSVALELPGQGELALAETPGHAPRQLSPHRPPRTRSRAPFFSAALLPGRCLRNPSSGPAGPHHQTAARRGGALPAAPCCIPEPDRSNHAIEGANKVPFHRWKTEPGRGNEPQVNAGGRRESRPNRSEARNDDVHLVSGLLQDQRVPSCLPGLSSATVKWQVPHFP